MHVSLCVVFQGIQEMELSHYAHGGINITGVRLVVFDDNPNTTAFLKLWSKLNPSTWQGAGRNKISVSIEEQQHYMPS